jgi:GntR family transcriptional regulator
LLGQVLDPRGAMPLYHQLAHLLRRKIMSGEFPPGATLPSESRLVSEYGISRVTVRQAVGVLVDEGLVDRASGRGTTVLTGAEAQVGQHFSGSLSDLIRETERSKVQDLQVECLRTPADVAAVLRLSDQEVVRVSRTRTLDGEVFAYSVDFLPLELGATVTEAILEETSLMGFFAASGVDMASARQAIRADVADVEIASRLHLRPGDPVLSVNRVIFNTQGKPLFCVQSFYRGDRYTYTVDLGLNVDSPASIHEDLA